LVSCFLTYVIDPRKVAEFEEYARLWIVLVGKFKGVHHGYFLPHEGRNNQAFAIFSFPSLAEYENYRIASQQDEECKKAYEFAERTGCILSYDRSFLRPVLS
jgi:hypothetical protein